jgi:hypothetical protein
VPIGLDHGANLVHCRNSYREGQWIEADFENPDRNLLDPDVLEQAVIICSDLIEHLRDPSSLVSLLKEWLRFARLGIISLPNGTCVGVSNTMGPAQSASYQGMERRGAG